MANQEQPNSSFEREVNPVRRLSYAAIRGGAHGCAHQMRATTVIIPSMHFFQCRLPPCSSREQLPPRSPARPTVSALRKADLTVKLQCASWGLCITDSDALVEGLQHVRAC